MQQYVVTSLQLHIKVNSILQQQCMILINLIDVGMDCVCICIWLLHFLSLMNLKKESTKKMENSSSLHEKRKSNTLVISTSFENSFDSRWAQIKIEGKNIPGRSNHTSAIFNNYLYIHGGYDVDRGLLSDFYRMDVSLQAQEYIWKPVNNTCDGHPIKLKNHSAVVHKEKMYVFGGESSTSQGSNTLYIFDFITEKWSKVLPKMGIPKLDSHAALVEDGSMYIYGGYLSETATYSNNIYRFNFDTFDWTLEYSAEALNVQPEPRCNLSMVAFEGFLWVFGGTNGANTLNDMWKYDIKAKKWAAIDTKNNPDPRRGHSMVIYNKMIFLFGGIQDITKEKNDVYLFEPNMQRWNKIQTATNSIYDCSPTLKRERKSNGRDHQLQIHPISPEKNSEKGSDVMKKIINENKQKKFQERKRELLKQFADKPTDHNKNRSLSPTTESMLKTLEAIGNQETSKKELKQEIMYDQSHRFIIGKKPCARDGQSVCLYEGKMLIFGGDRHLMAFNDLYSFDLDKGIQSLTVYQSVSK